MNNTPLQSRIDAIRFQNLIFGIPFLFSGMLLIKDVLAPIFNLYLDPWLIPPSLNAILFALLFVLLLANTIRYKRLTKEDRQIEATQASILNPNEVAILKNQKGLYTQMITLKYILYVVSVVFIFLLYQFKGIEKSTSQGGVVMLILITFVVFCILFGSLAAFVSTKKYLKKSSMDQK